MFMVTRTSLNCLNILIKLRKCTWRFEARVRRRKKMELGGVEKEINTDRNANDS